MIGLTIEYTDGTKKTLFVDDVTVSKSGYLTYYIRFGVNSGNYFIPFDRIKRWKIDR